MGYRGPMTIYLVRHAPVLGVAAIAASVGCTEPPEADSALTFSAFMRSDLVIPHGDDRWIVEGDIVIRGEERLRDYYERTHAEDAGTAERAWVELPFGVGGDVDVHDVERKLSLTYCVSDAFAGNKALVVQRVAAASVAWERATDVNFIYRPEFDAACTAGNDVYFAVVPVPDGGNLCVNAFFPHETLPQDRRLEVTPFGLSFTCDKNGYLFTHELGHVLGLHHEFARLAQCPEPSSDEQFLSEFDFRSVMGNQAICPQTVPLEVPSRRDVAGVKALYSLPKDGWIGRDPAGGMAFQTTRFLASTSHQIYWYTPSGSAGDVMQVGDGSATMTSISVTPPATGTRHRPLTGHFDSDSRSDIMFYTPGSDPDRLHRATTTSGQFSVFNTTINTFQWPILGNFHPVDGSSDILLYGPGPDGDQALLVGVFPVAVNVGDADDYYIPISGDFDGDQDTDILFYNPDSNTQPSKLMRCTGTGTFTTDDVDHTALGVLGNIDSKFFYTTATGDFNGDTRHDIFWYAPGQTTNGRFWIGDNTGLPLTGTAVRNIASTDVFKLFTGDFDDNGVTDILWYNQSAAGTDKVWLMFSGFIVSEVALDIGGPDFNLKLGDFNGDQRTDVYVWDPIGPDRVLRSNGNGTFTTVNVPQNPAGYPVGYGQG